MRSATGGGSAPWRRRSLRRKAGASTKSSALIRPPPYSPMGIWMAAREKIKRGAGNRTRPQRQGRMSKSPASRVYLLTASSKSRSDAVDREANLMTTDLWYLH